MKTLALVADDYGLAAPIDRGILRLAAAGRLSAVSCIVNAGEWRHSAAHLAALPVAAGLHWNLTEGRPLSGALAQAWPQLPSLPRLLLLAQLRRLPVAALRAELAAQLAAFESAYGRPPAHLDGHQHVHHLPQLRGLVLELLAARPALRVRATGRLAGPGFGFKRRVIEWTGGRTLARRLARRGQAQNRVLLGAYDFAATDYRALMQRWLRALPPEGALLFCHPGEAGAGDAIAAARVRELAYLEGDAFAADLAAAGVQLSLPGAA